MLLCNFIYLLVIFFLDNKFQPKHDDAPFNNKMNHFHDETEDEYEEDEDEFEADEPENEAEYKEIYETYLNRINNS